MKQLRKVPFDFYYRYVCDTPDGEKEHKHKIVDWEAGALFWKCRESYGIDWEKPFVSGGVKALKDGVARLSKALNNKEIVWPPSWG
ncbi:hypothetical protein ParKJ_40125 [Paraburkholderia fungorum]|uniref:Uncharacterized protein n=1 Tax=Paraburkholderia fungorum TaxID=134537 RepID=A0AAP5QG76_9BURK|nr:hypothetical protein [Paraburkholderia fungorum]MDT8843616.1 hypothetical protein [Paraburkholderia fungorum]